MTDILAIDPSSTCSGWALGLRKGRQVAIIRADRLKAPAKYKTAVARIQWQVDALWGIIDDHQPDDAIVEVTSGKVNIGRHGGGGAGLAIYGMAVGAIWQACHLHPDCRTTHTVPENEWTRSGARRTKSNRAALAGLVWPEYRNVKDPGNDISDAIALLDWFVGLLYNMEQNLLTFD